VTEADLSLMNSTTQFLGGLKLAISQNLQEGFVVEFEKTLHDLVRRNIDYVKERTNSRDAGDAVRAHRCHSRSRGLRCTEYCPARP
jgi:hypothetical protein